ncbi:MAG: peptidase U32 family protein [[Eubacterium] siraeum]
MLELLSPAGDLECLMSAVDYGCDAVYLGSTMFGMRAGAAKFDPETLRKGVEYAHAKRCKSISYLQYCTVKR